MSRLTKSYVAVNGNTYYEKVENPIVSHLDVSTKLGRLEDLEEQLGCPLEVVVKALTNGVYVIDEKTKEIQWILRGLYTFTRDGSTEAGFCDERVWRKKVNVAGIEFTPMYFWKDYKKTWWLKEDKSE